MANLMGLAMAREARVPANDSGVSGGVVYASIIDEAVELAKTLSTDESPRFVNGVLARILRDRSVLTAGENDPAPRAVEPPAQLP